MSQEAFNYTVLGISTVCSVIMAIVAVRSRAWSRKDADVQLLNTIADKVDEQRFSHERFMELLNRLSTDVQEIKRDTKEELTAIRGDIRAHENRISRVEGKLRIAS